MRLNFTVYVSVQNKEIVSEAVLAVLKKQRKAEVYYRAFKIRSVIPKLSSAGQLHTKPNYSDMTLYSRSKVWCYHRMSTQQDFLTVPTLLADRSGVLLHFHVCCTQSGFCTGSDILLVLVHTGILLKNKQKYNMRYRYAGEYNTEGMSTS